MTTYRELTGAGIPTRAAAALVGVPRATATRKPRIPVPDQARVPANKLTDVERAAVLRVVNSTRFVDLPPIQIYAQLLDEGVYLGSISTIYRVLTQNLQVKERRRLARHPARAIPELVATGPGQVYSWDITKLAGPVKGKYFDAYVMIDIYSRYIVGAHVHAHESAVLAAEMMREIFGIHGIPHVVHADRGTSMTSKTVAALLSDLEVTKSHSRPRVERQPVRRVVVQDAEVRPCVPRALRLPGRREDVHDDVRPGIQPPSPPHRHRPEHPRGRPLRPRCSEGHRTVRSPGRSPSAQPRTIRHHQGSQDPGHP